MVIEKTATKNKPHTIYRLADNSRVPGVTTITGNLGWSKETLCRWHNKMGLEGIDTKKYVDEKADIGTLAHAMVTDDLLGLTTDTSEYSQFQIGFAENSYLSFCEWRKGKSIEIVEVEKEYVSEINRFGGKLDILAYINGVLELIDLKTGSGIYPEHFVQVGGGYWLLAEEHGQEIKQARIINIPRSDDENFFEKIVPEIEVCKGVFLNCLYNHVAQKLLKGGK